MKLKVCGMKYKDNLKQLIAVQPDYIGFIFYKDSKRFVGDTLTPEEINNIPCTIKKTGVFVNENIIQVIETITKYKLDIVQLHGEESPEYCLSINKILPVIKAFNVDKTFDFEQLKKYESVCNYFLFDSKSDVLGGSGIKFDWDVLEKYTADVPYFLSGGIDIENVLEAFQYEPYAIDVNSKFEIEPGLKDINKIKTLKKVIGQ